jgi:hypothetical protein
VVHPANTTSRGPGRADDVEPPTPGSSGKWIERIHVSDAASEFELPGPYGFRSIVGCAISRSCRLSVDNFGPMYSADECRPDGSDLDAIRA